MSTYTQIIYHVIFTTKNREKNLLELNQKRLYRFICQTIENKNCKVFQINGMEDHMHLAIFLHPSISLSDLVKDIKVSSNYWIRREKIFPNFKSWQIGYGAFSYSIKELPRVVRYIKNQKEHHRKKSYIEESIKLLEDNGVKYDEAFLF